MLLFLLGFDTYFGHVLMKTAFIAEVFAVPLQKAVQHMYCPVDDNQQGIGGGNTVARIEPWREFGFLREDVRAGIVVEAIAKGCRIEAQSENGGRCRGRMWPWHLVVIQKPGDVIISQFAETRSANVNELNCGRNRSFQPFRAFNEVFDSRTRSLSHLVVLSSTWIVRVIQESATKIERGKLDDVGHGVGIEPPVSAA